MFRAREDIIVFSEKGIFLFKGNVSKTKEEIKEKSEEGLKEYINSTLGFIERESKKIIGNKRYKQKQWASRKN